MARPNWEYIRVDVLLPEHPKVEGLSDRAFRALIELWCYCGRQRTDGIVTSRQWKAVPPKARAELTSAGLARELADGGAEMHDYLEHNRSREEIGELSAKRTDAARRAAAARWGSGSDAKTHAKPDAKTHDERTCDPMPKAEAEAEADKDPPRASRVPPKGRTTATRLPADFTVTTQMVAWAREHVPHVDGRRETERFTDYWNSASGAKARKLDWTAAWRNWLRKAEDDIAARPQQRRSRTEEIDDLFAENYQIAAEIEEMEARRNDANGNGLAGGVRARALPAAGD